MKRSTPLRRTAFRRGKPVHVARDDGLLDVVGASGLRVCTPPLRRGTYAAPYRAIVAEPKRQYVRSRKLLDNVGKLTVCTLWCHCQRPVVACHSNWAVHGKGKGIKADDNRIAAGCADCHRELDQGKTDEATKRAVWLIGHRITIAALLREGLWPTGVPVPDMTDPFGVPAASAGDSGSHP